MYMNATTAGTDQNRKRTNKKPERVGNVDRNTQKKPLVDLLEGEKYVYLGINNHVFLTTHGRVFTYDTNRGKWFQRGLPKKHKISSGPYVTIDGSQYLVRLMVLNCFTEYDVNEYSAEIIDGNLYNFALSNIRPKKRISPQVKREVKEKISFSEFKWWDSYWKWKQGKGGDYLLWSLQNAL